ncbi:MAG: hypothetical protein IPO32_12780 [Crocinitomicaceae bacterium]|jgi:hypothetical protein|nr:hypothetical protein [Crocinitomicaceae bacterium]MBK6953133.1 hypothetical protein [Crocinitomicaceae bacterium]MBK9592321.1 hypothetical protein [Crocinitomicaceae bacterium]
MKTTNIGLVLLTVLVVTKYVISLDTYTSQDGSFKSGQLIDYSVMTDFIAAEKKASQPALLAYNPAVSESNLSNYTVSKEKQESAAISNQETTQIVNFTPVFKKNTDEVLPMEHSNSLVVFDPSNPEITDMKTQYVDQYDNAAPLDNGNTVVNEMLMMMPRR